MGYLCSAVTWVLAGHGRRLCGQQELLGKGNIGKEGERHLVSVDMDGDF